MSLLLLRSSVLYADNHVANDSHTMTVSEKLLVCGFRIILLCLYELVVEVNVILLALFQLPCGQQAIQEQCVQLVCRVEGIGLACVGCVGDVILGQFLCGSENRVGTTCAKCRVKREMVHQMRAWSQIAPLLKIFLQKE